MDGKAYDTAFVQVSNIAIPLMETIVSFSYIFENHDLTFVGVCTKQTRIIKCVITGTLAPFIKQTLKNIRVAPVSSELCYIAISIIIFFELLSITCVGLDTTPPPPQARPGSQTAGCEPTTTHRSPCTHTYTGQIMETKKVQ